MFFFPKTYGEAYCCEHNILTEGVFVTQLSTNAGLSLSPKELYEGNPRGRAPLQGSPKDMQIKALEIGSGNWRLFPQGPRLWGTWRDAPF